MRRLRLWLARLVAPKGVEVLDVCHEDFLQRLVDYMQSGGRVGPVGDGKAPFCAPGNADGWTVSHHDEPLGVTWARDEDGRPLTPGE